MKQHKRTEMSPDEKRWVTCVARFRFLTARQVAGLSGSPVARVAVEAGVARLVERRWLERHRVPRLGPPMFGVTHRASHSLALFGVVRRHRGTFTPSRAVAAWQRAQLWLAYRRAGWEVGRNARASSALAAHLASGARVSPQLSEQIRSCPALAKPDFSTCTCGARPAPGADSCWRCGHVVAARAIYRCTACGRVSTRPDFVHRSSGTGSQRCPGELIPADLLDVDVAWRPGTGGGVPEVHLLVADDPHRSVASQLARLPVRFGAVHPETRRPVYPPPTPIVFVPRDDSTWDPVAREWAVVGPRLRAFQSLARWTGPNRPDRPFAYGRVLEPLSPPADVPFNRFRRYDFG